MAVPAPPTFRTAHGPLRTYIVEDSAMIRENLIDTLEEMAPVEVVGTADNETGAVNWITAQADMCDLVIVDIFLKAGSGLGVLQACSQASRTRDLKMVVLSNYATPDMQHRCRKLGADQVFDKSKDIDALLSYCNALAQGTRRNG
ncbi:MAG: response regulator [Burkholderiaceae bacterium]